MISLRKYLIAGMRDESAGESRRIVGLLLRGLYLHAIEGEKAEYEQFRADLAALEGRISGQLPPGEALVLAGSVIKTLEDYNQRTTRFVHRQSAELQKMVSMLAETIITMSGANERSLGRLQEIEKSLDNATEMGDIRLLKQRVENCLETVRNEAQRQKTEGDQTLRRLKEELQNSQERTAGFPRAEELDVVTGLPNCDEARRALQTALAISKRQYAVAAVVSRVQAVNARFGYAVGDRVLKMFSMHFQSGLRPEDRLFRWRGPVLLALVEREESIEEVRRELHRFADMKLEQTLEIGSRTILMAISAIWTVFPVSSPLETLLDKIDNFIANQVSHEHV